jgi:hypothetical protein
VAVSEALWLVSGGDLTAEGIPAEGGLMPEGQGQHADTRRRHDTGASLAWKTQRFWATATLRHTLATSPKTLVAQGIVCLMPLLRMRRMPGQTI